MSGHDWQAIGSAAGAVGLLLALYTFVTDRLQRRVAEVELRFELTQLPDPGGKIRTDAWLVVHNHGPRKATDVDIEFRQVDNTPADPRRRGSGGTLEVVWPGQEYRESLRIGLNTHLKDAEVVWSDGRLRRQRRRYLVSFHNV